MSNGNREIERKYLLTALPPRVLTAPVVHIDQGYLPGIRINERVRRSKRDGAVRYYRTIKSGVGIERLEVEEQIEERFFSAVWPLTLGHRVEKRRYEVADGEFVWEVDEFLDRSGLWLAEVELSAVEQVATLPGWLAEFVEREVTEEERYTNHALSK